MSLLERFVKFLNQMTASAEGSAASRSASTERDATVLTPAVRTRNKVLLVNYDPLIPSKGGRRLTDVMGWMKPLDMAAQFINDMKECSHDFARFEIVEAVDIDDLPVKMDGYQYTGDEFLSLLRAKSGFHQPDQADYKLILKQQKIVARLERTEIDEVWLFGPPYCGFFESRMIGPGAFWCNAPPIEGAKYGDRRAVLMGFNYERGVGEMLESMGHRAESILQHAFRRAPAEDDLWDRFMRIELTHPGQAEVGSVHFAPNSLHDYDWGNREYVLSRCDTWLRFPDLKGQPVRVNRDAWGGGDMRLHHLWWMERFPHAGGRTAGVSNNWWSFIMDPNQVR
jgi:hypothetical protein